MKRAGVVGLGDMGSGLAKNLIAAGHPTAGFDLSERRMADFVALGGQPADGPRAVGAAAEAVFVMVMTGAQAKAAILGPDGVAAGMAPGGTVLLTATVHAREAREIAEGLAGTGIGLIDSPVSGGFPGAQAGTLTMMAAGDRATFEAAADVMGAVGETIFHVGEAPGQGQTVKACLQALLGSMFTATFEAAAMAAKAGVAGQVFHDVVSKSSGGAPLVNNALQKIIDREFTGTGSHIRTMHKDLTIAMDLGRETGAPLFTAAAAMQLFQAGLTRHPDGDNWIVTRVLEEITGAEVRR